jgi:nucleoid DNA-binding protein
MSAYLAEKQEMSQKDSKELLAEVFAMIEAGVLRGERVPLGKIGKVYAKIKPATKARMGRNPITGEEIKIAAKKATKVPKFTFSKGFKEEVLKAKIKSK